MNIKKIAKVSKALGDPYRLQIMAAVQQARSWLPCSAIQRKFDISQPTISHHLRLLVEADLLFMQKEGRCTRYIVNKEAIREYIRFLNPFQENQV